MTEELKPAEKKFVKEYLENGNNGTQAVKKAFGTKHYPTARVKASRLLTKSNIQNVIQAALPDELLAKVHREGLKAEHEIWKNNNATKMIEFVGTEPDYAVRHRYLDSAYKIKGTYAPEKTVNLNVNSEITSPEARKLAEDFEKALKEKL
jgi:hypothetical protein